MTVLEMRADPEHLTLTVVAEFAAPVEHLWQAWADPRRLERWLGPPHHDATVDEFDLRPDGRVRYYTAEPGGQPHTGTWRVVSVDAPQSLVVEDSFADRAGTPDDAMPTTTMEVSLRAVGPGTREQDRTIMTVTNRYPSIAAMEALIENGQAGGMADAMGQIEEILEV